MSRLAVRCIVFGVACAALCFVTAASKAEESADGLWTFRTSNAAPSSGMQTWAVPQVYRSATLDTTGLDGELANAAWEGPNVDVPTQGAEINLPLPDGTFQRFSVVRARILSAVLQAANPDLATYRGIGLDDSEATVSCTRSVLGFQCVIRRPAGTVYIDPLYRGNDEIHAVYDYRTNMAGSSFSCECEDMAASLAAPGGGLGAPAGLVSSGATRRDLRLALVCSAEYTAFWGGAGAAIAGATATIGNVSAVLENDCTVRLNIGEIRVFANAATDPFDRVGSRNTQLQNELDTSPPVGGYDIGHLFDSFGGSISGDAGCIGCICGANRGSGWSDGGPTPTGGNMDFLVLHEMGHQLGGRHSWTGTTCAASQWDSNSSVEPGSGSTIMSYASVCGASDEVLGGAVGNLYYHADSVDRIVSVTSAAACRTDVGTGNGAPSVNAGADFTIPMGTPFTLFATASDPDGDPLTYCWEQMDVSPMTYPYNQVDTGDNPLFRSRPPTPWPGIRWFPQLSDVFAGNFFPGTLGEQLPSTNRTMNFWCTVRDNVASGGGIDQDSMSLTVDAATGPFRVLSPNGGESLLVGVPVNITWDVAGTTGGGVNAADVQIQLWDSVTLAWGALTTLTTPNDGLWEWTPSCSHLLATARIRVVSIVPGVSHGFYDVSDNDFEIVDITPPVVTCNIMRSILWPPRNGLLPLGFNWAQAPDDCDPAPTRTLSIYSTEADGLPPYSPDWMFAAPFNLRLRAERAYPGPGRVYIVVVNSTDASGNRGVDCCTTIVPALPYGSHIMTLRGTAMAAEAACLASPTDVPPAGFVTLVSGVPLP